MKNVFFTPGPSQLFKSYGKHLKKALKENIPSVSHRGSVFMNLFNETRINLMQIFRIPDSHKIYFLSSATECMERILQSTVKLYSHHFVNGAFSGLFYNTALNLKIKASLTEADPGMDYADFSVPEKAELVCYTHNETSTGVSINLNDIDYKEIKNKNILTALDIVSSAPYVSVDFSEFDLVFFSVQKGFGLPAGLGVLIVSPGALMKAEEVLNKGKSRRSYHDLLNLEKYALKNQTPETPNVLNIYMLNEVVKDMIKYGINNIRKETDYKAKLIYDCFNKMNYLTPTVKNNQIRSKTVCVADTTGESGKLIEILKKKNIIIGAGYKVMKDKQIRIANFPSHSVDDISVLIKELSMADIKLK